MSLTALCGAAGSGLLLAALTMDPPRPPQPRPAAALQLPDPVLVPASLPRAEPARIEIPAINVSAELLSQGVDAKGELAVPPLDKAQMASWYNLGPSPGEPGSAVIVGHVDSEQIGAAVFFNLGRLAPGHEIRVYRKDGTIAWFTVDAVHSFLKADFPTQLIYDSAGYATLRVITCGGEYDKKTKNYLSNVVVFASYTPHG